MTMHALNGGTWRTITLPSVRVAGVWTAVSEGWTRVSGVWQQFYSAAAMTAAIAPTLAYGARFGIGTATTNSVTCTPTAGTSPFTYAWTRVSGDIFTVTSPTAATTTFSKTVAPGAIYTGVYRCTITDSLGATASATASTEVEGLV